MKYLAKVVDNAVFTESVKFQTQFLLYFSPLILCASV